jgi:hypothetical protein
MLSFRSILLAAAVFATIASAIPTPATPEDALPDHLGLTNPDPEDIAGKATKTVTVIVDGLAYEGHPGPEFRKRGGSSTSNPVEIFKNCHDGIADIVVQLSQYSFFLSFSIQTKLHRSVYC